MGPEGYGSLDFGLSQMLHALADLVSKNIFGFTSWYLRFKIIKKWEAEQKRIKREAEEKSKEGAGDLQVIDPAFDRAYAGGYGAPMGPDFPSSALTTLPAALAATTSRLAPAMASATSTGFDSAGLDRKGWAIEAPPSRM